MSKSAFNWVFQWYKCPHPVLHWSCCNTLSCIKLNILVNFSKYFYQEIFFHFSIYVLMLRKEIMRGEKKNSNTVILVSRFYNPKSDFLCDTRKYFSDLLDFLRFGQSCSPEHAKQRLSLIQYLLQSFSVQQQLLNRTPVWKLEHKMHEVNIMCINYEYIYFYLCMRGFRQGCGTCSRRFCYEKKLFTDLTAHSRDHPPLQGTNNFYLISSGLLWGP